MMPPPRAPAAFQLTGPGCLRELPAQPGCAEPCGAASLHPCLRAGPCCLGLDAGSRLLLVLRLLGCPLGMAQKSKTDACGLSLWCLQAAFPALPPLVGH